MFARFDEIQTMTLQDIEKTKHYGQTNGHMHTQEDNMKTVYPLASDVETVLPSYSFICKFGLFVSMLYVKFNNFSVMSRRFSVFEFLG